MSCVANKGGHLQGPGALRQSMSVWGVLTEAYHPLTGLMLSMSLSLASVKGASLDLHYQARSACLKSSGPSGSQAIIVIQLAGSGLVKSVLLLLMLQSNPVAFICTM